MKRIVLVLVLFVCINVSLNAATISGTVKSIDGDSLDHALVTVVELGLHTSTYALGTYSFSDIPAGHYLVQARLIGYTAKAIQIEVTSDTAMLHLDFVLESSPFQTSTVVVSAETEPSTTVESPLSASILDGRSLAIQRAQSIAGTISLLPGVREFSGGPIMSKPVVRGLTSQRVLVAKNGLLIGSQTWDEPQAPEASVFDVDRIEVVRGPNSVMFGSDAIGGVVNIVTPDLFANPDGTKHGLIELNGFSNTLGGAGALSLGIADSSYGGRIILSGRYAGDYYSPGGTLPNGTVLRSGSVFNSGGTDFSGSAVGGIRGSWGTLQADFTGITQRSEIHPEPGRKEIEIDPITGEPDTVDASPVQEIQHERLTLTSVLPFSGALIELTGGFQYNSRKEEGVNKEEGDKEETPEVLLDLYTATFDAKTSINDVATVGLSVLHQRNQSLGRKAIIPYYTQLNLGAYAYREQVISNTVRAMGGLRFDHRTLDAMANQSLLSPDTSLSYDALSGNIGISWMFHEGWSVSATAGTGWRAPVAAELFGRGKDEGIVRYKIGRSDLQPERSVNTEIGLRANTSSVRLDIAVYRNNIQDFIGLAPTDSVIEGLPVYSYFQSNATISGVEFSLEATVTDWLVTGLGADLLRGDDDDANQPLPLMPADRISFLLAYNNNDMSWIQDFLFALRPRYILKQSRVAQMEEETPSYFVLDASVGGNFNFGSTPVHTEVVMQNLTNTAYVDHLSRYKEFAFNPGLNVALKIAIPIW